jgi:hypothetical protein
MTAVLVDMDATLIESVLSDDPRYHTAHGRLVSYRDDDGNIVKMRVHIRPHAVAMIRQLVDCGFRYILWSAGVRDYVLAVMQYFNETSGVKPERTYTREDMVPEAGKRNNKKYKSMKAIGIDQFFIIDDNPDLIIPSERDRIINIRAWSMEEHTDKHLNWVSNLLRIYRDDIPITTRKSRSRFKFDVSELH